MTNFQNSFVQETPTEYAFSDQFWEWSLSFVVCGLLTFTALTSTDLLCLCGLPGDGVVCGPAHLQEPLWGGRGHGSGRLQQGHRPGPRPGAIWEHRQQGHLLWCLHSRYYTAPIGLHGFPISSSGRAVKFEGMGWIPWEHTHSEASISHMFSILDKGVY